MTGLFGIQPVAPLQARWASLATERVAYVFAFALGYYIHHWLLHRYNWLWEFHKPHHAAEVLTVLATFRVHPLEELITGTLTTLATALVHGFFLYINGPDANFIHIGAYNAIMLVFYLTFFNLRHTHFWIPVRGFWGHIILSPAHHQIHHSTGPKHYNKNFGFVLSFWDWVFGTLHVPAAKREVPGFGIGAESVRYDRLMPYLFLPFINNWRRLMRKSRRGDAADSLQDAE